jgi:hypothetical protein
VTSSPLNSVSSVLDLPRPLRTAIRGADYLRGYLSGEIHPAAIPTQAFVFWNPSHPRYLFPMSDLTNPPVHPVPKNPWENPFIFSGLVALAVAFYVALVLFTRYESTHTLERRNAVKQAEQRRANDLAAIQELGGSDLAIRTLYLSPPAIYRGEKSQVCYDVANAKTVTLNPPVGEVWPSHSRCIDVSPTKDTTYALTITDDKGHSTSQSIELKVQERPPVHLKQFPSQ